jgi:hypothetical protein
MQSEFTYCVFRLLNLLLLVSLMDLFLLKRCTLSQFCYWQSINHLSRSRFSLWTYRTHSTSITTPSGEFGVQPDSQVSVLLECLQFCFWRSAISCRFFTGAVSVFVPSRSCLYETIFIQLLYLYIPETLPEDDRDRLDILIR